MLFLNFLKIFVHLFLCTIIPTGCGIMNIGTICYRMVQNGTEWYRMVRNGTEWYRAKSRILANVNTLIVSVDSLQFVA